MSTPPENTPVAPTWLQEFSHDVYSQSGEDGVIEKVLATLPSRDHWCVEFGAWDGVHLSNTRNLVVNRSYNAVLIEAEARKYDALRNTYRDVPGVYALHAFVGFRQEDGLDSLLASLPIPADFDLLSIDIDGNDYHAWHAMTNYRPKVVCIEFNPTVPTEVDFVQPADHRVSQGASLKALVRLGRDKGYELVSVLEYNAIFVARRFFPLFGIADNKPETLRTHSGWVTYLFTGYDGRMFLCGNKSLPWHGIEMRESAIQHLPRFLRSFPNRYSVWQAMAFRPVKFVARLRSVMMLLRKNPGEILSKIRTKLRNS